MSETSSAYQDASRDHEPSVGSALDEAAALPSVLEGHWTSPEGLEMARRYAAMSRANLTMADRPDFGLANAIYLIGRDDLGLLGLQTAAKERIRWLSAQLALSRASERRLLEALRIMEAEKADYMIRNNLGDPANQHSNKLARAAIAAALGPQVVGESSRDDLKSGGRTS